MRKGSHASEETRKRLSESHKGIIPTDATRRKRSDSLRKYYEDHPDAAKHRFDSHPDLREKISKANRGKKRGSRPNDVVEKISAANRGKKRSEETKRKLSEAHKGRKNPSSTLALIRGTSEFEAARIAGLRGSKKSDAWKEKMSGSNHPNWKGGVTFFPYCPKFNDRLKEEVRDAYYRKCAICGKTEQDNGGRHAIHHVDRDKEQGCNGKRWSLVPLCRSCHGKVHFNNSLLNNIKIFSC